MKTVTIEQVYDLTNRITFITGFYVLLRIILI